jgi:aryl-alcohol dehydrogenase-like predicted oxidoreductase
MQYKPFAKSNESISLLGYGAWGIGKTMWIGADDKESKRALHRAIEKGINFFDSALVYGNGHSERLIGEVEREAGKKLFITSKMPSKKFEWPARDSSSLQVSFPKDYIIRTTERSLKNLGRDYIDLQQFHVWTDTWAKEDAWKEAIEQLKRDGKVRYFGISTNNHEPENGIQAVKTGLIDSLQVIFNIFDQQALDKLFPFCEKNKTSVIVRVPLDEGGLTGNITPETVFPKGDWRNGYFQGNRKLQVYNRVKKIWQEGKEECENMAELALRFTISFSAVTTVIPGMRTEKNLLANVRSVEKGPLSHALVQKLKAHRWLRNFY